MIKKTFGQLIKSERQNKGLTQQEVVALAGISESELIRLEADRVKKPRQKTLKLLTACFGLELNPVLASFGYSLE